MNADDEAIITLVMVDDHELVRTGIEKFLDMQSDIKLVGSAASGEQAIELVAETVPDMVLMDLNLGQGMNGIEATRAIKRISPNTDVLVLTSYHSDEFIFPAIKAGARSYLLKDIAPIELANAIRKTALGHAVLSPIVAKRIVAELNPISKQSTPKHSQLSGRELQVIKAIADGKNNQEIAQDLSITIKTVRSHVSNILSKLHLRDRTQAAIHAWQQGLVDNKNSEN